MAPGTHGADLNTAGMGATGSKAGLSIKGPGGALRAAITFPVVPAISGPASDSDSITSNKGKPQAQPFIFTLNAKIAWLQTHFGLNKNSLPGAKKCHLGRQALDRHIYIKGVKDEVRKWNEEPDGMVLAAIDPWQIADKPFGVK